MAESHSPRARVTSRKALDRRGFLKGALGLTAGLLPGLYATRAGAEALSCLPVARMAPVPGTPPANKKIGVSVAYLKVPFYANFKTGLQDGQSNSDSPTISSTETAGMSRPSSQTFRISSPRNTISSS